MTRHGVAALVALVFACAPCRAQLLQKLEQNLLNGQNSAAGLQARRAAIMQRQQGLIGNVNMQPGKYMITNAQTGQSFYVTVHNGRMFFSGNAGAPPMMAPPQTSMMPQAQRYFVPAAQGMMQPPVQVGGGAPYNSGLGTVMQYPAAQQPMLGQ